MMAHLFFKHSTWSHQFWDWPGVKLLDTTADAVTGVTALTPCPVAMATTSAGAAAAVTALCWVWTNWAVAVPAACESNTTNKINRKLLHSNFPNIYSNNNKEKDTWSRFRNLERDIQNKWKQWIK